MSIRMCARFLIIPLVVSLAACSPAPKQQEAPPEAPAEVVPTPAPETVQPAEEPAAPAEEAETPAEEVETPAEEAAAANLEDLSGAVIFTAEDSTVQAKAAEMLQDEIAKRTGIEPPITDVTPEPGAAAIVLGTVDTITEVPEDVAVPEKAESYAIWADGPSVKLVGRDDRGALFAAGRLLRLLTMRQGELALDPETRLTATPRYRVRGHELGFRHTSNTYDKWDLAQYEQYIRDLVVFGANMVQLIPNMDPELVDGPHMDGTIWDTTEQLTELIGSYGLDVWFWFPPSEDEPLVGDGGEKALLQSRGAFERFSPIDAVFIPGGDPGDTHPEVLLPWMEQLKPVLAETHPDAELWLSNEAMAKDWNEYLFEYLQTKKPDWLTGIIYGCWTKISIQDQRARIPAQFPMVQYSDITHCTECEYPVPNWDVAFASTLSREPINPRPLGTTAIFNYAAPDTVGFVTYSDGVNDDVNKIIWSVLGWDPEADVEGILREYGRYFIGEDYADDVAQGLLALEKNWEGPAIDNPGIEPTLALWQSMETEATKGNWRFQMGLLRAYYDAHVQRKLKVQADLEQKALAALREAETVGAEKAVQAAKEALAAADAEPPAADLRARIDELGEALFNSIGMQLSVEKYGAKNWERGAVLDALDRNLNDRIWLEERMEEAMAASDEAEKVRLLLAAANWEDPGPGGFYDDLGNAFKQPHLVQDIPWASDPGFVESPQCEQGSFKGRENWRLSWLNQGQTLYGTPLRMRYEGLDPQAKYELRIVYTGRFRPTMRLTADNEYLIHADLKQPEKPEVLSFDIPAEATSDGALELEWELISGRGCQVGEVWLVTR